MGLVLTFNIFMGYARHSENPVMSALVAFGMIMAGVFFWLMVVDVLHAVGWLAVRCLHKAGWRRAGE